MSYAENRVRVSEYGSLSGDSPLLAPVPTAPGLPQQRAHVLAARAAAAIGEDVRRDLGISLLFASGWRPRLWKSREEYRKALVAQYKERLVKTWKRPVTDDEVFAYGRLLRAYESPHETGLALDLGCGGMEPVSATIRKQEETPLYRWLVANMWRHGFTPYLREPWHLEMRVPLGAYRDPWTVRRGAPLPPPPPSSQVIRAEDNYCEVDRDV